MHFATDLAAGQVPSVRRIQRELHVGQPRAKALREQMQSAVNSTERTSPNSPRAGRAHLRKQPPAGSPSRSEVTIMAEQPSAASRRARRPTMTTPSRARSSRSPASCAAPRRSRSAAQPGERRAIIPEHLRTWQGIARRCSWHLPPGRHHALYHGVRSPQRLALTLRWALRRRRPDRVRAARLVVGVASRRTCGTRPSRPDDAAEVADPAQARPRGPARPRLRLLGAEVLALALAAGVGDLVPAAAVAARSALVAVPLLAWIGRPDGQADPDQRRRAGRRRAADDGAASSARSARSASPR